MVPPDFPLPPPSLPPDGRGNAPCTEPVQETEAGQKLLGFLQRRLDLPLALLHRWIRTGQVRRNGRRCKAFDRVESGDTVRVPPFAPDMAARNPSHTPPEAPPRDVPPLIGQNGHVWAFNKPAGLPTHPGTGHQDSLATRIAGHWARAAFTPTPAHRLDKDTSGVLLAAASYAALREVQDALREGSLIREYVAWVEGCWPHAHTHVLRHSLRRTGEDGCEKMRAAPPGTFGGREAACLVQPLTVSARESLLLVRLLTGRTHQIRAQMAAAGHPVRGDGKYGAAPLRPGAQAHAALLLHSLRVVLPGGHVFACLPPWKGRHALHAMPLLLEQPARKVKKPRPLPTSLRSERGFGL